MFWVIIWKYLLSIYEYKHAVFYIWDYFGNWQSLNLHQQVLIFHMVRINCTNPFRTFLSLSNNQEQTLSEHNAIQNKWVIAPEKFNS